ncbi:MAG: adenylosuccinate lyase [Thermoplasmatota archaeon]
MTLLACPLDFRYGRSDMKEIFSEEGKLARLLQVEASVARAHAAVGNIPKAAADEIGRKATTEFVRPARVHEIESEIRHDMMAVVKALAEACEGNAGGFVHLGVTSYDIIDTANALMMRDGLALIEEGLVELEDALANLARTHRDTVMVGRTHGQHAVPMTFGLKISVFLLETHRHIERLRESKRRSIAGKVMGAIGTGAGLGPRVFEIQDFVAGDLGISMEDGATQIVQRDRWNELFGHFANLSVSLEKFATEVRNLQRNEIGEAAEGFDVARQVGSSTMAQKRNPVTSEKICGLARIVRSNLVPAWENSIQWHERDLTNSSAERFILPHTFVLLDEIVQDSIDLFRNLQVNPERMRRNLMANPTTLAESVMLRLADHGMDRQEAHEAVRKASLRGGSFREALLQDSVIQKYMTAVDIDAALEPANYLGKSVELVDRALRSTGH